MNGSLEVSILSDQISFIIEKVIKCLLKSKCSEESDSLRQSSKGNLQLYTTSSLKENVFYVLLIVSDFLVMWERQHV